MKKGTFCVLFTTVLCYGFYLDASEVHFNAKDNSNGVPNQSARFGSDEWSFDFFGDLLIWTAREVGSDCWAEVITTNGSVSSNTLKQVHFGWDPGFRVGFDYGMEYDQWDTAIYFTWFYTRGKDHVSSVPGSVHSAFMGNFYVNNPTGAGITGPAYQSAGINWKIHFNIFDGELGRNFWVSKSLALRPFIGLKGGWIHQSIHSNWNNPNLSGPAFYHTGKEKVKNNSWGIGPSLGTNMQWNLFKRSWNSLYLFGDFSGALMWGHWSFSDVFHNDIEEQVTVNLHDVNTAASVVRSFTGLGWSTNFRENRYRISLRLGYEAQFWLDELQFYSFIGGRLDSALTLQGGTLELAFDF